MCIPCTRPGADPEILQGGWQYNIILRRVARYINSMVGGYSHSFHPHHLGQPLMVCIQRWFLHPSKQGPFVVGRQLFDVVPMKAKMAGHCLPISYSYCSSSFIVGYSINDRVVPLIIILSHFCVLVGFRSLLQSAEFIEGVGREVTRPSAALWCQL